jgi:hypothetical protein
LRAGRRLAIGLLASMLLATHASASIVLLVRGEDRIFIAADTRGTSPNPDRQPFASCKVVASATTAIAFIGVRGMQELQVDIADPLRRLLDEGLEYRELLRRLDAEMATFLPGFIEGALRFDPALASLLERRRGLFLGIVVVGIQDGEPVWRARHYTRSERDGRVRIRHRDRLCAVDCRPGETLMLDGPRGIGRELRRLDTQTLTRNWPREARRLIARAADESRSIGLPAVSLEVTADGVRWLEQHAVCESS